MRAHVCFSSNLLRTGKYSTPCPNFIQTGEKYILCQIWSFDDCASDVMFSPRTVGSGEKGGHVSLRFGGEGECMDFCSLMFAPARVLMTILIFPT